MRPIADRTAIAGRVIVLAALVLGVASLPSAERAVGEQGRSGDLPVVDGVTAIAGMPPGTVEVIRRVRRDLPDREPLRIVNEAGVCRRLALTRGQGTVYWLQYQLLPRPITCDPEARWSLYVRTPPPALAPGARRTAIGTDFVLVRRPDGRP